jgi:hypothetical protein
VINASDNCVVEFDSQLFVGVMRIAYPSETHKLQFMMDLDANATDERICSVLRGPFVIRIH